MESSDPPQVVRLYRSNGWDFIAFTEHEFYSYWQELRGGDDFLVLPGIEMGLDIPKFGRCHPSLGHTQIGERRKTLSKSPARRKRWHGWSSGGNLPLRERGLLDHLLSPLVVPG